MHCERIEITQAHRPGGITPRRGLLLPCRVGAVGLVYAVGRSVGRCTAFLCCRRVVYPCTVPGVLWAVCGAVGVALRRRPTFLPKKDFYRFFQGIRNRTPPERGFAVRLQALHQHTIEKINTNPYSINRQQKRDSNITLFVFDTNGTAPGRIGTYIFLHLTAAGGELVKPLIFPALLIFC